ncbi:MAG: hypothetical protein RLT05_32805 [Bauldia litoralis]
MFAISYSDYVFSSFLIADDNIVIPSALFGETEIEPNSPGRSLLVALGGLTGSIAFVKALALLFFPAIAVLCYVIARQVGAGQLAAACIALFIVTFPVAVEQPYFVSGAHPTMATVFGLAAIASFLRSYDDERRFRNAFAASFFLCVVAAAFSPQMFLFPAAPIAWAAAALAFGRIRLRQFVIAVAITGPIVLIAGYVAYKSHHYGGLVGWTEISVSNVLANLVEVLSRPIETILAQDLSIRIAHALLVLVLIGLAAVAFIGRDRSAASAVDGRAKRGAFVFVVCVMAAGAAFGPVSITTSFATRYDVPVFIFGALAILAPAGMLFRRLPRPAATALGVLLVVLATSNMHVRVAVASSMHGASLKAHYRMARIVERDSMDWPASAQVVFMLSDPMTMTTGAFNHWSTWYIRGLAKRRDIIGLVGGEHWVSRGPFVAAYRDNGEEYWVIVGGRSRRIKMIGLETDRPLFVYEMGKDRKRPRARTYLFQSAGRTMVVPPGTRPDTADVVYDLERALQLETKFSVWPSDVPGIAHGADECDFDADPAVAVTGTIVALDGQERVGLDLPVETGDCVDLTLRITPANRVAAAQPYSDTWPPMPMLGAGLSIYQREGGAVVDGLKHDRTLSLPHTDEEQEVILRIVGREGAWFHLTRDGRNHPLAARSLAAPITLGKGFKDRYWTGEIEIRLSVDGGSVPPDAIGLSRSER